MPMSLQALNSLSGFCTIGLNEGRRHLTIQLSRIPPFGLHFVAEDSGKQRGTAELFPNGSQPLHVHVSPRFRALLLDTTMRPWTAAAVFATGVDLVEGTYELVPNLDSVDFTKITMLIGTPP